MGFSITGEVRQMPAIRKSGGGTANRYFWNGIGIQKDGRGRQNGRERGSADKMEDKENFSVSEGHMDPALEEANTSEAVREGKAPFYNMKKGFSRIGWSLVAVLGVWQILMLLIGVAAVWQEELYDLPAVNFYYRYLLLFNEGTLAAALIVGSFLLRPIPCSAPASPPVFRRTLFSAAVHMLRGIHCRKPYRLAFSFSLECGKRQLRRQCRVGGHF